MATYTWDPAAAVSPLASGQAFVPTPWRQEPSATSYANYTSDDSITISGSTTFTKIKDGWSWWIVGSPGSTHTYARTEMGLSRASGPNTPFPAGQLSTVAWKGYYTSELPAVVTGEYLVTPGQIHDDVDYSPHYTLSLNSGTEVLYIEIHNLDGSFDRRVPIYTFGQMVNNSTNITMHYKPNSAIGTADGSMTVEVNGRCVFSEAGVENSNDPGRDYSRFGIYDFTNAITDPDDTGGDRELTLATEFYQVDNR